MTQFSGLKGSHIVEKNLPDLPRSQREDWGRKGRGKRESRPIILRGHFERWRGPPNARSPWVEKKWGIYNGKKKKVPNHANQKWGGSVESLP